MNKISVCIATFNGGKFIKEQLESILPQLNEKDEIIISDDSSTDNTIDIIKSLNDKRIILLTNNFFKSPIYNFENSLKYCSGDYIFLSDQDDIWDPMKIKNIIPLFKSYNVIVSDCKVVNFDESVIYKSFFEVRKSGKGFLKNLYQNTYLGCCMAFDRKILLHSLPFPKDIPMHDMWIGLIGEVFGKVKFLSLPLVSYRRHENSATITASGSKSNYSIEKQLIFRLRLIKNIFKRLLINNA